MASSTTPKTLKKLGQFLEEQQEPFILEIYLSERGFINNNNKKKKKKKKLKLISGKFLKGSVSLNNIIKGAYYKLSSPKIKNENDGQEIEEANRFSSASTTTIDFNSCSEGIVHLQKDDICQFTENEVASVRQEDSELISPVSVLQEKENQSKSSITIAKKITEDSLLWNLVFHSAKDKQCCVGAAEAELEEQPNSQFYKSKKILQQTKQLLFDCVREVLKTHDENGKNRRYLQSSCKKFMGPELLGKLMTEKIKAWGKQSGDELNISRLLDFDFQDSVYEWTNFQPQMRNVAFEIGDAIIEDIRDQIVRDMVSTRY